MAFIVKYLVDRFTAADADALKAEMLRLIALGLKIERQSV
jgi:hypothetical protein